MTVQMMIAWCIKIIHESGYNTNSGFGSIFKIKGDAAGFISIQKYKYPKIIK